MRKPENRTKLSLCAHVWEIKDKGKDYLRKQPNPDDLSTLKAIVKGEESNFMCASYAPGKRNKANRTKNKRFFI